MSRSQKKSPPFYAIILNENNCPVIGMIWILFAILGVVDSSYRLLQLELLQMPLLEILLLALFTILACLQGFWFIKKRGFFPLAGNLFFFGIIIYVSYAAPVILAQASSSNASGGHWQTTFLTILTIFSILGCRRASVANKGSSLP
ncbi:MAG: hypothetical protein HQL49_03190 [Gammaproteobacteria bacterium]|nr:hypothetical protein [Gammaproteobacteria bacterium]